MILLDTSGLLSALSPDQKHHARCRSILSSHSGPLMLSPFVLAELDYLVLKALGVSAELAVLAEVARGAYRLETFSAADVDEATEVISKHRDQSIGLADASIVVLSRRTGVLDVLTLDERHFRPLRGARSRPFRILPFDERR